MDGYARFRTDVIVVIRISTYEADPDPTYHFDEDPDAYHVFYLMRMRIRTVRVSGFPK
jgi:hypothetical protein